MDEDEGEKGVNVDEWLKHAKSEAFQSLFFILFHFFGDLPRVAVKTVKIIKCVGTDLGHAQVHYYHLKRRNNNRKLLSSARSKEVFLALAKQISSNRGRPTMIVG